MVSKDPADYISESAQVLSHKRRDKGTRPSGETGDGVLVLDDVGELLAEELRALVAVNASSLGENGLAVIDLEPVDKCLELE